VRQPWGLKHFSARRLQRVKSDPADAHTLAALGWLIGDGSMALGRRGAPRGGAFCDAPGRGAVPNRQQDQPAHRAWVPRARAGVGRPDLHERSGSAAPCPDRAGRRPKRITTLAEANRSPGHRAVRPTKATQIQALAKDTIAPPELASQIGFEMELLIAQHDLLEQQIAWAEALVAGIVWGIWRGDHDLTPEPRSFENEIWG